MRRYVIDIYTHETYYAMKWDDVINLYKEVDANYDNICKHARFKNINVPLDKTANNVFMLFCLTLIMINNNNTDAEILLHF